MVRHDTVNERTVGAAGVSQAADLDEIGYLADAGGRLYRSRQSVLLDNIELVLSDLNARRHILLRSARCVRTLEHTPSGASAGAAKKGVFEHMFKALSADADFDRTS